ncbi:unnamed protein product [Mytilus edulis]|uniref:Endonuclease/exonuclease/phosphatase domain-containing protein n=1 Tax=Mytilus edulis TaxID=6550 RepID=A0A8S3U8U6_MYTED|nr:unnamed protein product [Mytilus edulis]
MLHVQSSSSVKLVNDFNHQGLCCIYTNADSFMNKLDEFKTRFLCDAKTPDIIAITEVVPKNMRYILTKAELNLNGYELFPSNFPGKAKRGIIVYIKNSINATEVDIDSEFEESVWIKIPLLGHDNLLYGCIYKSPSSDESKHKALNDLLNKASNLGHNFTHILINGDFNFPDIDWENWTAKNETSTEFIECLRENFLHQMVAKPTRIRINQEPSILDLIIVNDLNNIANIEHLDPLGASDHCVLKYDYMCYFKYTECAIERLNYYKADYVALRQELNIDWEKELEHKNTNDMLKAFMDKFNQAVSKHVPKSRPKNSKGNTTLSKETLSSVRRKHRLWERYMEKKSEESHREFCKARNKV